MQSTPTLLRILSVLVCASALQGQSYTFQAYTVPVPSDPDRRDTEPGGINNRGATVGFFEYATKFATGFETTKLRGFKRDADGVIEFPIIEPDDNSFYTEVLGINDSGTVVGYYGATGFQGFIRSGGVFTTISYQPGGNTVVAAVNNKGDFAGSFGFQFYPEHGFITINGVMTQIDGPDGKGAGVYGLAEDGSSVGFCSQGGFMRGPKGNYRILTLASGLAPAPTGINNEAGVIVGVYEESPNAVHGFVYNYLAASAPDSSAPIAITTVDFPGATVTVIDGVNSKGQLSGWAQTCAGSCGSRFGFIATPVASQ